MQKDKVNVQGSCVEFSFEFNSTKKIIGEASIQIEINNQIRKKKLYKNTLSITFKCANV